MRRTDCACHRVSIPAAFFDASASFWHCWNLTTEGKAREIVKERLTLPTEAREGSRRSVRPRGHQERLITVVAVAQVDGNVVRRALALAWPDFEDAVCAAAAEAGGCDGLVMSDPEANPMDRSR